MDTRLKRPIGRIEDWRLPLGVDRALWEYMNDASIADEYDDSLVGTNLLQLDREWLDGECQRPGRLIELGCGSGRLLLDFARRGFDVVGVDLSATMLEVARRKRDACGLAFPLVQANLCDLSMFAGSRFDYAICMFSVLGMIVGGEARRRALRDVHRILRPGGIFALHVHNFWYNLSDPSGRRWLLGNLFASAVGAGRLGDKVMYNHLKAKNLRLHLFRYGELSRVLAKTGFKRRSVVPLAADRAGRLRWRWLCSGLRANGWLVACQKKFY